MIGRLFESKRDRLLPRALGVVAALVFLAALPTSGLGQDVMVGGRVYDPTNNSGVQNARITLAGHGTTLSNRDGTFVFRGVGRGEYELRVQAVGYQELQLALTLVRDTTLALPLKVDPFEVDSIDVVLERIDIDGRVRDPRTGSWVADADVRSDQGHRESTNLFGRFDLDDVFDGPPLRLIIRGFGYLPLDTTFIPNDEDPHIFSMAADPVITRMIDRYMARLDDRAGERMYEYQPALNREDLAQFSANTTLRQVMEAKYPLHILRRIECFFLDEQEYRFISDDHRLSVFEGTFANEIARIELLEFPGPGRLFMARVYTRRFFQRQVGSPDDLAKPSITPTPGGTFCR